PHRQRRQAIGVNVFRTLLQFGKRSQRIACLGIARVVHLDEDRAISLHDKGIGWIVLRSHGGSLGFWLLRFAHAHYILVLSNRETCSLVGWRKACKAKWAWKDQHSVLRE